MNKRGYFDTFWENDWPKPDWLRPYFLSSSERRWFFESGNDGAIFYAEGTDGTEHLDPGGGRIDIHLEMWGHPGLGVLIIWSKWGGGYRETFSSKGDMSQIRKWVRNLHGDPLPVGLFIPFDIAWKAVEEFILTDGKLPTRIEWVANRDLPPNSFPDPWEDV